MPVLPWTFEHMELASQLISEKLSADKIANALNERFGTTYSRNSVIGKAIRMGTPCCARSAGPTKVRVKKPIMVTLRKPPPRLIEAAAPADEPVSLRLTCVELESEHCRWPSGDERITFCGTQRLEGKPYCAWHQPLSVGNGTRSEQTAHRLDTSRG
jgi:GcrA cell cycle regulator